MERLKRKDEFDRLLEEPLAIVLKHSTTCPVSARAHQETESFVEAHPEAVVRTVHVIEDRAVSDYIEERTSLRHQSPQVLVLRHGEVVWHDSHFAVTANALAEHAT